MVRLRRVSKLDIVRIICKNTPFFNLRGSHNVMVIVRRIVSVLAVFCFAQSVPAFAAQFVRSDNGVSINYDNVEHSLTMGGVLANLSAGESVEFYGFKIHAQQDSVIYLSVSSEFVSAACLGGAFTAQGSDEVAGKGKVYVHAYGGNKTNLYDFDIERFLGSSSLTIDSEIRAGLNETMHDQSRKKFWGLLQVSNTNSQAAVTPHVEAVRRDYLLQPEVVHIRKEADGDTEKMSRLSAERFVQALSSRNGQATASLLHPALFSKGRTPDEWIGLRLNFAKDMTGSALAPKMKNAVIGEGSLEKGYVVSLKNGEQYQLKTESMDAMVFVKSIRKM